MPSKQQLSDWIIRYLEHLEIEKGRSQLTLRNYHRYLSIFAEFAREQVGVEVLIKHIDDALMRKFRQHLSRQLTRDGEPLQASTRNYYLIALRNLLKYLHRQDIKCYPAEKIELAKAVRPQVAVLQPDKLSLMLKSPDLTTLWGLRDRAIMETFFSTGLRVAELAKLNREQVNTDRHEFVVRGKGSKDRLVFLSEEAARHLGNYLRRREDRYRPVFLNHQRLEISPEDKQGESLRLTTRSFQRIIVKHARRAGIVEQITPHTLRHTFATDLLNNGADLRSVQELLGHANIQTTQIYTHISNRRLHEVHQQFHRKGK